MSSKFPPHFMLPYKPDTRMLILCSEIVADAEYNIATPDQRRYSTILGEFPWYSEELVLKPKSILANSHKLPGYEVSSITSSGPVTSS